MIDPLKVQAAVEGGLSYVCALCERYWEARDKNIPGDKCTSEKGCGSPIAGDVFHDYKGPLTVFDKYCFACGVPATHGISVSMYVRVIGACEEHIELVKTLKPQDKEAVNVKVSGEESDTKDSKLRLKLI